MLRSFIVAASLSGFLFAAISATGVLASEAPSASNIGFVLYSKSHAPGTLNARWNYANRYSGPGIATGGPREGFAGRYHVRYFLDSGEFSDEYDLVIEKTAESYKVSWIVDGNVLAFGIGMELELSLIHILRAHE